MGGTRFAPFVIIQLEKAALFGQSNIVLAVPLQYCSTALISIRCFPLSITASKDYKFISTI